MAPIQHSAAEASLEHWVERPQRWDHADVHRHPAGAPHRGNPSLRRNRQRSSGLWCCCPAQPTKPWKIGSPSRDLWADTSTRVHHILRSDHAHAEVLWKGNVALGNPYRTKSWRQNVSIRKEAIRKKNANPTPTVSCSFFDRPKEVVHSTSYHWKLKCWRHDPCWSR